MKFAIAAENSNRQSLFHPPKSAFIIFSAEKHREIKKTLLDEGKSLKVRFECLSSAILETGFAHLASARLTLGEDNRNCQNGVGSLEGP